jgi:hypothetical protein
MPRVVAPSGKRAVIDLHDRILGVVARPRCGAIDMQRLVLVDGSVHAGSTGVTPSSGQIWRPPHEAQMGSISRSNTQNGCAARDLKPEPAD